VRGIGHAPPICMTVAGSDPSGGAGLQADLKTFHAHGVFGTSAVTLLTVQNTRGVTAVELVDEDLVVAQMRAVLDDLEPAAIKTGALGSAGMVRRVAEVLRDHRARHPGVRIVVDPVLVSKHGHALADDATAEALRRFLLPWADATTPNAHELSRLAEREFAPTDEATMVAVARELQVFGPAVVAKSPATGIDGRSVDLLVTADDVRRFEAPTLDTTSRHGSGCAFAAAITARLAFGDALPDAVRRAKAWVHAAIEQAPRIGHGTGPLRLDVPVPSE